MLSKVVKPVGGKRRKAFTLAEVLIALVVIGIIATITVAIINTNVRKAEIEAKLKKTVSVLNGALYRASIDYGDASNWAESKNTDAGADVFLQKYIMPYIVTLKPITETTLADLGYTKGIKTPIGANFRRLNILTHKQQRVFLNDGTVLLQLSEGGATNQYVYTIDINGPKGPNIAGKDVFLLSIDLKTGTPVVSTVGLLDNDGTENDWDSLKSECKITAIYCSTLIQKNGWKIPSDYPLKL